MTPNLPCLYFDSCSGCSYLTTPFQEQIELKLQDLKSNLLARLSQVQVGAPAWPEINWVPIAHGGLRDRVDMMIDSRDGHPRLGLFSVERRTILDIEKCPQMSKDLGDWYIQFRKTRIPVERGSVRLRVSPSGQRGLWLDLANIDVKRLLDERTTLDSLRSQSIVEIGQRRKRLFEREGQLKLGDPQLEPWFETYIDTPGVSETSCTPVPLYCTVGSFTQPGFQANKILVQLVRDRLKETGVRRVVEFGSGIGNFTLPAASVCDHVFAYEVDRLALKGLEISLNKTALQNKVTLHDGDFQEGRKKQADFNDMDLILVDPPRSGLMKFLDPLENLPLLKRPKHFLYVSCFAESFAHDAARLLSMGYRFMSLAIVDQFPQSRHYEIVASFSL